MPPKELWLIRHAQSTSNCGEWNSDPKSIALSPLGKEQAVQLALEIPQQPDLVIVSPYQRTLETAAPIIDRWPNTPVETWPIQEINYLSPTKCAQMTHEERRAAVRQYWKKCDPFLHDGDNAEPFSDFVHRLHIFQQQLAALDKEFVVAVGHGQFFKAFTLGIKNPCLPTAEWMRWFRQQEVLQPLKNCEIIKL